MAIYLDDPRCLQAGHYLPVYSGLYPYQNERLPGFQPRFQTSVLQPVFGRDVPVLYDTRERQTYLMSQSVPGNDSFSSNETPQWMFRDAGGFGRVLPDYLVPQHSSVVNLVPNTNWTNSQVNPLCNGTEEQGFISDQRFICDPLYSGIKQEYVSAAVDDGVDDESGKLMMFCLFLFPYM